MTVFAALGDSTTAGYGDRIRGAWRGWAPILAQALGVRLHNFSTSGARAHDIERDQLPKALAVRPAIAAVLIGTNDTLRDPFDGDRIGGHIERTVAALREAGAEVLTIRLPAPGAIFGLPGPLARPLARRMAELNGAADRVAASYDTLHFDAAGHPDSYRPEMWSVDRLHPSERGHRFLACSYFDLLEERGVVGSLRAGGLDPVRPSPEPTGRPPSKLAQGLWLTTAGAAWMVRRSTDLLPGLTRLAWSEWRHGSPAGSPLVADLDLLEQLDPVPGRVA
ncbi:SGNH/GDSL hydrolase family protein [Dactylosporangium matsuzakiense]|uniref:SGNH hydrolase n=1 Tax=Dactylosporangium matsuzakiense TaxID=53360 RepID=A0A9W6KGE6_9ACTN|nr:SGNH/GDSL hydrolase family protein [Dactylosporangium matsuzakiense]UWZ44034.1 SGNH/GDSL hydrolase family protein [Dactylosporangium matsuzakiense]GLL00723.1 SGNH hydrolase [Dactylosporangium matsuzakiense]